MLSLATNALHYFRYRVGLDQAKTQTTEAERRLFQEIAPGRKVIVELGVFEGVSSRLFRGAMDNDAELYGVDPFPVGRLLFSPQHAISAREISKSANGSVHLLRCLSYEAVRDWKKPIDLLYMDGDHSFDGVTRDFRDWSPFVASGGLILIHTSHSSPNKLVPESCGPLRLVKEIVACDAGFKIKEHVDSTTVVEKL